MCGYLQGSLFGDGLEVDQKETTCAGPILFETNPLFSKSGVFGLHCCWHVLFIYSFNVYLFICLFTDDFL